MFLPKGNGALSSSASEQCSAAGNSVAKILFTCGSRCWFIFLVLVGTGSVIGCGGPSAADIAPVHGTVTLDGKPLTEGFVFVAPAEGKIAKGAIQPDGTFVLGTNSYSDGAKIGTHPVSVKPLPAQEGMPPSAVAKSLPHHYTNARTSGITVDVKPDIDNELKIELTTQQQ